MDYLPIQASSVPSERVFSSSGETDTQKRNRISPILMEALQMLKFSLKKERQNIGAKLMTEESELEDPRGSDPDPEMLGELFAGGFEDNLDRILRAMHEDD